MKSVIERSCFFLLAAFVAILPFGNIFPDSITDKAPVLARLLSIVIILLGVNRVVFWFLCRNKFSGLWILIIVSFSLLFIYHAVGMLWTENTREGFRDLEVKLTLVLFPVLIGFSAGLSHKKYLKILSVFIYSCIISLVLCFFSVVAEYGFSDSSKFFYMEFSRFIHPSYFSMYLTFALISHLYLRKEKFNPGQNIYVFIFVAFILIAGHFFLASKTGLLILLVVTGCGLIYATVRYKKIVPGIIAIILLGLFSFFAVKYIPVVQNRFSALVESLGAPVDVHSRESSAIRKVIWTEASAIISENPFGTGTGDVKDELMKAYIAKDITLGIEKKLNAHNEFLQLGLALGIPGLFFLLLTILTGIIYSLKTGQKLYLIFLGLIFMNFLTESMLETQAGVLFFAFFNSFLLFGLRQSEFD